LFLCGTIAACAGTIVDPDDDGTTGGSAPGQPNGVPGPGVAEQCVDPDVPNVGVAPLRRLTRLEYDNTVRDLLGDTTAPAADFAPDEAVGGYDANAIAAVSKLQIEDYLDAAETLAKTFVASKLAGAVSCDIALSSCVRPFIESFGLRAFRRPLTQEESDIYTAVYESGRTQWGAQSGVELAIRGFLSSPNFLYHVENVQPSADGKVARVDMHTLASRLSYFLWSSMPDDELLSVAESGGLETPEGVEVQARRMLADPKAADTIASFHEQWLGIQAIEEVAKDTELFPEWTPALATSMREETRRFVSHVVLDGDARLSTLLTATYSFVNPALAKIYGVPAPTSGFVQADLDPHERAGLLTHPSLLTALSGASETSWVHRGKFVREQLLCDILSPPPPGVEATDPKDPGRLENPECMGCHLKMDPIGIGFDAYGPIGTHRLTDEQGKAVSTAGEVIDETGKIDAAGKFDGAVELARRLADSDHVARCVATQWFRFAARRIETTADACTLATVQETFITSGNDVRELMIALTKTPAFRYRAVTQ
jgi:hypothetical protein